MDDMKLIFSGDLLAPERLTDHGSSEFLALFDSASTVANLEGPVIKESECDVIDKYKYNLSSTNDALAFFKRVGLKYVSLANNHISDFTGGIEKTKSVLNENGISYFGTKDKPFLEIKGNVPIVLIGLKSVVTGGSIEKGADSVVAFNPRRLIRLVKNLKEENPKRKIVIFPHWGYELDEYPQPADRVLARTLIDNGADLVIGHHPHVIQGIERYNKKYIFYSLGNFCLSQGHYSGKHLQHHTDLVLRGLLLETNSHLSEFRLHWISYDKEQNSISHVRTTDVDDEQIRSLTPYAGYSDADYRNMFKNRSVQKGGKMKYPTFISYFGIWGLHSVLMNRYFLFLQWVRKTAIQHGLHKPYNW